MLTLCTILKLSLLSMSLFCILLGLIILALLPALRVLLDILEVNEEERERY